TPPRIAAAIRTKRSRPKLSVPRGCARLGPRSIPPRSSPPPSQVSQGATTKTTNVVMIGTSANQCRLLLSRIGRQLPTDPTVDLRRHGHANPVHGREPKQHLGKTRQIPHLRKMPSI